MIKVVPNEVVCKECMSKLEYEASDVVINTATYPNIEYRDDKWIVDGEVVVKYKHIVCPVCNSKVKLNY